MVDIKNACHTFLHQTRDDMTWKWDNRFQAVLGEFASEKNDKMHASMQNFLANKWDSTTIETAPQIIKKVTDFLGGLRAEQLLFASDPDLDNFIFCAWWPWGNGETISLRIAPIYKKLTPPEREEQVNQFKNWFGV